jgi:hypothetical protein
VECKGLVFDEPLRFDLLVDDCLLVELKAVEILHPSSKAQLFSYMKLLDIPIGLLIDFSLNGSAVFNTGVGDGALQFNVNGAGNTAMGVGARTNNQVSLLTAVALD